MYMTQLQVVIFVLRFSEMAQRVCALALLLASPLWQWAGSSCVCVCVGVCARECVLQM